LENNGIRTLVGDSVSDGGRLAARIAEADILVAILTHASSLLERALTQIAHATTRKKDLILLRDASLAAALPPTLAQLPWIDVDFSRGAASIVMRLFAELDERSVRRARARKEQDDTLGIVLLALGALAAGVALSKGRAPGG
jgi:hypothetical protein